MTPSLRTKPSARESKALQRPSGAIMCAFDSAIVVAGAQMRRGHIPGAINVQANTIKQNLDKIPKGKKIIAYCS